MIVEIAQFRAQPGKAEELQAGFLKGLEVIRSGEGCLSAVARRGIEDPDTFVLEVAWETLEHHTVKFRGGPLFPQYRSHINGLFIDTPTVNHYEEVKGGAVSDTVG
jgi:quinol monooxygenase YgiN